MPLDQKANLTFLHIILNDQFFITTDITLRIVNIEAYSLRDTVKTSESQLLQIHYIEHPFLSCLLHFSLTSNSKNKYIYIYAYIYTLLGNVEYLLPNTQFSFGQQNGQEYQTVSKPIKINMYSKRHIIFLQMFTFSCLLLGRRAYVQSHCLVFTDHIRFTISP